MSARLRLASFGDLDEVDPYEWRAMAWNAVRTQGGLVEAAQSLHISLEKLLTVLEDRTPRTPKRTISGVQPAVRPPRDSDPAWGRNRDSFPGTPSIGKPDSR